MPYLAEGQNVTLSIHGTIIDDNGTPLKDATVTLVDLNDIRLNKTVTDAAGRFDFVNETPTTENCSLQIVYADDNTYITPTNYYRMIPGSGIQYVNITRFKIHDYPPPPSLIENIPSCVMVPALAILAVVLLITAFAILKLKRLPGIKKK